MNTNIKMIDFVKVKIIDIDPEILTKNKLLNFCTEINPETGELRDRNRNNQMRTQYINAFYKSMEFRIYESGTIYLSGSLHKYWNDGEHNFNDFDYEAFVSVLKDLKQKFNIDADQLILRQLEIGVNIVPPYPTNDILNFCFIHRGRQFNRISVPDEGRYIQAEHSQYFIKIYDKANHYRRKGYDVPYSELLRFEIKYRKMEKLKKLNIISLGDIVRMGFGDFVELLSTEWKAVLFYDFTILYDKETHLKYSNKLFWLELRNRPSAFNKHRRKLRYIVEYHSEQIAYCVNKRIVDKCLQLMDGVQVLTNNVA